MALRLTDRKTLPKDGFPYIQPETGRSFPGMFSFNYQVAEILTHRKANQLARATSEESAQDLDSYTCGRVPSICYDPGARRDTPYFPRPTGGCSSCGGHAAA